MKKLKDKIKRNGFIYWLVHRSELVAIYAQCDKDKRLGFEVFEVVRMKENRFKDVIIPEREKFPSNRDFGNKAFSVPSLAAAIQKAFVLEKRIRKRKKGDKAKILGNAPFIRINAPQ